MLGIRYIKFDANTYVLHYKNGKLKKEGRGLSFWYFAPTSSIVAIPMGSDDAQFIFEETTADFQTVTIQGQTTYKIANPKQLAELLDYTVDKNGHYAADDHEKLSQRLVNEAQAAIKARVQSLSLKQAIRDVKNLEEQIMQGLSSTTALEMLGIEPLSVNVIAVKPVPEMARALEAETREALQQEADEAIYSRRKFAVEQERMIKESELNTQIAVEEKKKQIAEKKMETDIAKAENDRKLRELKIAADIEIETERQKLIDLQTDNERKQADATAYRLQQVLAQYKDMDWKLLSALQNNDSKSQVAVAFRELAENAKRIGTLNITPDLLETLMDK